MRHGVIITSGVSDWQILQQDDSGYAAIALEGTWRSNDGGPGVVETRLAFEDTSAPVSRDHSWTAATTHPDGTWSTTIERIPAGGLYRLETRLNNAARTRADWSQRGDTRHFLGVGDLWIIAGQSNSAGYGRGSYDDPPELGTHILRNSMEWALATHPLNDSTNTKHLANTEGCTSGHSPYLNFARWLKRELHYPIGLIATSLGGSPLSAWNPAQSEAPLFRTMVDCVNAAGGNAKGVVWYQGESEAGGENAAQYADQFLEAVGHWRAALSNPKLYVITAQLNRYTQGSGSDEGWSLVRESQRIAAKRDEYVTVVPTSDLGLTDHIHNGPAGNMVLGARMANSALQHVYACQVSGDAPDIACARFANGRRAIDLRFDEVESMLTAIDEKPVPFVVQDNNGIVLIAQTVLPIDIGTSRPLAAERDTIRLVLDRDAVGATMVSAGYGANPPQLPFDIERVMPILSFHNVPVTE